MCPCANTHLAEVLGVREGHAALAALDVFLNQALDAQRELAQLLLCGKSRV